MGHVVTQPIKPFTTPSGALRIHQVPSMQDNLIWVIEDAKTQEAAAVDGPEAGNTLAYCEAQGLKLTTIINTHTHFDHIGINADLGARGLLDAMRVVGPQLAAKSVPGITEEVNEGDTTTFGGVTARVLLTEGHINGHVSYVFEDVVFCGDTMFGAGCGYLFDGPAEKMHDSLTRLAELDAGTRVCCAHEYTQDNLRFAWSVEPDNDDLAERIRRDWKTRADGGCTVPSTIATERATNPFLRHASASLRDRVAAQMPDRDLGTAANIFAATRALKDRKDYRKITDDELPL